MADADIEAKMREDWNDRAQRGWMQYTGGTDTNNEQDYVDAAIRDANTIRKYLGDVDTKEWKALDVGCGAGRIVQQLAPQFAEVHGVDVSDEMIKLATERLKPFDHVKLHRTDGADLKMFEENTFQMMWSYSVFYHIPRTVYYSYLKELTRVMAPGGLLIYQMGQTYSFRRWLQAIFRIEPDAQDTNRRRFFTKKHLHELATENGFEVVSIEPGPGHDLWCYWKKK